MSYMRDAAGRRLDAIEVPPRSDSIRAMRALRAGFPTQPVPRVSAPTVSLASAVPGSTPTAWPAVVSGAPSTAFRYSGGSMDVEGAVFPYSSYTRWKPLPVGPGTFGSSIVDFHTDSPALTVTLNRTQNGAARLLVDNDDGRGFVEAFTCVPTTRTATAQAGGASTITLDSGASATNGMYVANWVRIQSGTGAGQTAQITGYVGSTKVATVDHAWTTTPDSTSVFELTLSKSTHTNSTQAGFSSYCFTLDWAGERRHRRYRLELAGFAFAGVNVTSVLDSVYPADRPTGTPTLWGGDSFSAGSGTDATVWQALARACCDQMGWSLINLSIGGTGLCHDGGTVNSFNLLDRWFPAVNSWVVQAGLGATGSYTVTQSGTTVTVNVTDTIAAIQAAFDSAFGAGNFKIAGTGGPQWWAIARNTLATSTAAMTANFAGTTNGLNRISQYLGDLAPAMPLDGQGKPIPVNIVIAMGHNDVNVAYTPTQVQTAAETLIGKIKAAYPLARIYMIGVMYMRGGLAGQPVTDVHNALIAASAKLPLINGKTPFVASTWNPNMITGSGYEGALAGNGASDILCYQDGVHPKPGGHQLFGRRIADEFARFES